MDKVYNDTAKILKVLSDPKRLRIVDMLSCGELCACELLEAFHITEEKVIPIAIAVATMKVNRIVVAKAIETAVVGQNKIYNSV